MGEVTTGRGASAGERDALRHRDRIGSSPRFTEAEAIRLNRLYRGQDADDVLNSIICERLLGDVAVVTSFGAESAILLHLVAALDRAVPIFFIDTGMHFPDTLEYRDTLIAHLRLGDVRTIAASKKEIALSDAKSERHLWDPDGCCNLRKVAPLSHALAEFDAVLNGRKAFHSAGRSRLPRFEIDGMDGQGRIKVNPLIDWSQEDLSAYRARHELPAHPLVAKGFPSIGCAPCSSRVNDGEDCRSGRWRGMAKTECGIHSALNRQP